MAIQRIHSTHFQPFLEIGDDLRLYKKNILVHPSSLPKHHEEIDLLATSARTGTVLLFNNYLPPKGRIVEVQNSNFHSSGHALVGAHTQTRTVYLPEQRENEVGEKGPFLEQDSSRFSVFHEIGHLVGNKELSHQRNRLKKRIDELLAEARNDFQEGSITGKQKGRLVTLIGKAGPVMIASENEANEFATLCLNWARSAGINLEPNLSNDELDEIIRAKLKTYEDFFTTAVDIDEELRKTDNPFF